MSLLATDKILASSENGVGWLIFNNPGRRNAVSLEMWQAVGTVLEAFEQDQAIRVVVLRGAGGKAFVSGADISQFEDQRKNAAQAELYAKVSDAARRRLHGFTKPMIAMIQGYCVGGGVMVAAAADLRVAADDARFAIPAARLGLGYGFDSITKLLGLVGPACAKDLLFTARRIEAAEALRIGLVNRVVAVEQLEAEVLDMATAIAANAPLTLRAAKLGIDQAMRDPADRDMTAIAEAIRACFESEDYAIGRRAFMEKRTPTFTGR